MRDPVIGIVLGIAFVIVGLGLLFVTVDADKLRKKSHTNPMLALYRFSFWRYGLALVAIGGGLISILCATGWIG